MLRCCARCSMLHNTQRFQTLCKFINCRPSTLPLAEVLDSRFLAVLFRTYLFLQSGWAATCYRFPSHNTIVEIISSFAIWSSNVLLKTLYSLPAAIGWTPTQSTFVAFYSAQIQAAGKTRTRHGHFTIRFETCQTAPVTVASYSTHFVKNEPASHHTLGTLPPLTVNPLPVFINFQRKQRFISDADQQTVDVLLE